MVRAWRSHASSHSADALVIAEFPNVKDAIAAVEVLEGWISNPRSKTDFEDSLTYHEGRTVVSSVYSEDDEAVDTVCGILKKNGASKVESTWNSVHATVSVVGASMQEVESRMAGFDSALAKVFDPRNYVAGKTAWKETRGGRSEFSTSGYLGEGKCVVHHDDATDERDLVEILGVKVSELRGLGCSVRAFYDVGMMVQRQRVVVFFNKPCDSQQEADAFYKAVRAKLEVLFDLRPDSPELPDVVSFYNKTASVTFAKIGNVSFEKTGHLIYNGGVFGDLYGGTAEAADLVSKELHCRLDVTYSGEAGIRRHEFRRYEDGKLVKHVVPSDVDLVSPMVQRFQEIMNELEAKGLVREADDAKRVFLEMMAKKRGEIYRV